MAVESGSLGLFYCRIAVDLIAFLLPNSVYSYVHPQILADYQRQDLLQLRPRRKCPHSQGPPPESHLLAGRSPPASPSRLACPGPQTHLGSVRPKGPARWSGTGSRTPRTRHQSAVCPSTLAGADLQLRLIIRARRSSAYRGIARGWPSPRRLPVLVASGFGRHSRAGGSQRAHTAINLRHDAQPTDSSGQRVSHAGLDPL